ncbi:hypothetical protein GGS20DRAFT_548094 [Poronia punctata]|nr:hypothetical protein GGS20DRAFT_548094 [Poronia punctata]
MLVYTRRIRRSMQGGLSSQITAFNLKAEERRSVLDDITHQLAHAKTMLQQAEQHRQHKQPCKCNEEEIDYEACLSLIDETLYLASDPDACNPSVAVAPLATCNLYRGHALVGLCRYVEAREAYESVVTGDPDVADEAQRCLTDELLFTKAKREKERERARVRTTPSSTSTSPPGSTHLDGEGGSRDRRIRRMQRAARAILLAEGVVTFRPGPVRRRPVIVHMNEDGIVRERPRRAVFVRSNTR